MRTEREWSQAKAGEILGKPQNVISRLESPAYGKLSIQTLMEIAQGFDVGLIIKFVPFSRFLNEYNDVSFGALSAPSPTDKAEIQAIWHWAAPKEAPRPQKRQPSANTSQGRLFLDKGSVLQGGANSQQVVTGPAKLTDYISKVAKPRSTYEQVLEQSQTGNQQLERAA